MLVDPPMVLGIVKTIEKYIILALLRWDVRGRARTSAGRAGRAYGLQFKRLKWAHMGLSGMNKASAAFI